LAQDTRLVQSVEEHKEINSLIKNILVPFDESQISHHAFDFALDLARKYHAKISVLTIMLNKMSSSSFLEQASHQNIIDRQRMIQVDHIIGIMHDIAKESNVELKSEVIFSEDVSNSILSFAAHHKIDLIIMGTRARNGPKAFLIGSVAMDVLQKSSCPVIFVK
jgi:nucleotide-binding universal stress UspA family protein